MGWGFIRAPNSFISIAVPSGPGSSLLAGYGKTIVARSNVDGPHVWDKPGLSGYLVCLVYHVYLALPDETDQIDETDRIDHMNKTGWRTFSASC